MEVPLVVTFWVKKMILAKAFDNVDGKITVIKYIILRHINSANASLIFFIFSRKLARVKATCLLLKFIVVTQGLILEPI